MKENETIQFKYTGVQFGEETKDVEVIVNLNYDTVFELRYLLAHAAEREELYGHIANAVHLRDTLCECFQRAIDENEVQDED